METIDKVSAKTNNKVGLGSTDKRSLFWVFFILGLLILTSLVYAQADRYYMYLVVYMWFGLTYGMMLQYGRFCMASASRDLFAAGVPRMAVGIMVALVFFSLVQAILHATDMSTFTPAPFGIHMPIAGMIFGIGMVLAGGCASGTLYKVGEGNGTSFLALLGICFGQAIFAIAGGPLRSLLPQSWIESSAAKGLPPEMVNSWFDVYLTGYVWNQPTIQISKTKFIENTFPGASAYFVGDALLNAIIPAILLLTLIYIAVVRKGFIKKIKKAKGSSSLRDDLAGFWSMITASKRTTIMGVLIGITAGLHIWVLAGMQKKFAISNFGELLTRMGHAGDVSIRGTVFDPGYWYITTQEAQFAAWIMEKFGIDMRSNVFFGVVNGIPELWRNPALWMSIGIIFGAAIIALINKEFKLKLPKGELIALGIIGGLLMGMGSRPSLGCNIGAFFIRAAGGDPNGWLYLLGMAAGAFVGVKWLNWYTERKMEKQMQAFDI
ncbi:MAG: YeeE/YedE family protein [Actinobacteria bacterium]|nr:YeeE/YedE family protein [Actinomycetota bacterium]